MRRCRRNTFRWIVFQGSVRQSSVRACTSAIRPDLLQYLYLPVFRLHVSVSAALRAALASWGILPSRSLMAGCLLCTTESAARLSRSGAYVVCPSLCAGCRWVLYTGLVWYAVGLSMANPTQSHSLLGQPVSQRRLVLPDDASANLYLRSPYPRAQRSRAVWLSLTAFSALLPTFDNQSPAAGRCSRSGTRSGWS